MNSKRLEQMENIAMGVMKFCEKVQGWMEQVEEMRNNQIEMETGLNKEFMTIWLKGKILSVMPTQWKETACRILF